MAFPASPVTTAHESSRPLTGLRTQAFDARDPDLTTHWNTCLARSAPDQRFLTQAWYSSWLATYGAQSPWTGQGHVLVVTTDTHQAVGLLPLTAARNRGLRFMALAGYIQPARSLVIDAEVAEAAGAALASALLEGPLPYDLLRVGPIDLATPGHRGFMEGLRKHTVFMDILVLPQGVVCRDVPADFDEYQAKVMGRSFVKWVQRQERRVQRAGGVVRHYRNPSGEELETVLRECRLVEGRSWLATSAERRLRFQTERDFQFWRQLAASGPPEDGGIDVWMLYFGSQPASYCLTLTAGGIRYDISNQYDEQFSNYSTGSVVFFRLMEDTCNSGIRIFNFGNGFPEYKGRWGGIEEGEGIEVLVFPRGLKGRCLAALYKQLKRVRPGWVRPR